MVCIFIFKYNSIKIYNTRFNCKTVMQISVLYVFQKVCLNLINKVVGMSKKNHSRKYNQPNFFFQNGPNNSNNIHF